MFKMKKLFSKEIADRHVIYRFMGIKLALLDRQYVKFLEEDNKKSVKIQDGYDLTPLKTAKKLIVFFVPSEVRINGGIMSIYSLCEMSRKLNPDAECIISTYPQEKYNYAHNDKFENNEKIYRFSQVVENCADLDELILHIPEYYVEYFEKRLSSKDKNFFETVPNVHFNIMNQNIKKMPSAGVIEKLYKYAGNITQTIAHDRYATQEVCNKYKIPTHLFSVSIPLDKYKKYSFEEKEKIIVLSPDKSGFKDLITEELEKRLPEFKLVTVRDLSFPEYMDLISRAYFSITFGEGMDGYFIQPYAVGSIGFAVYNDTFFPDSSYKEQPVVYLSYEDMKNRIVDDITGFVNNKEQYEETVRNVLGLFGKVYNIEEFKDNLLRFYKKEYDYLPE